MPLISVRTSAAAAAGEALLIELSSSLAALLGKPERYVMTLLETELPMTFAGDPAPACYVEVKSIGALDGDRTRQVSQAVCALRGCAGPPLGLERRHLRLRGLGLHVPPLPASTLSDCVQQPETGERNPVPG
jgi:hypothetical protein